MIYVGRVGKLRNNCVNVRVDRQSPLGNPFYMKNESMRDEVCRQYAVYFAEQVNVDSDVRRMFEQILAAHKLGKDINLQCHCAPKRCHADTIKAWLEAQ